MKKIIITCCAIATMCIHGYAQTTHDGHQTKAGQSSINVLADYAKTFIVLLNDNKTEEATALYKVIVVGLLGELDATEHHLIAAKGSSDEQYFAELIKKQGKLYGEVFALRNDLKAGKNSLSVFLNEFIEVSATKH